MRGIRRAHRLTLLLKREVLKSASADAGRHCMSMLPSALSHLSHASSARGQISWRHCLRCTGGQPPAWGGLAARETSAGEPPHEAGMGPSEAEALPAVSSGSFTPSPPACGSADRARRPSNAQTARKAFGHRPAAVAASGWRRCWRAGAHSCWCRTRRRRRPARA